MSVGCHTRPGLVLSVRKLLAGLRAKRGRRRLPATVPSTTDHLEARLLLTTLTVQNLNDSGPGSLRAAVAASQQGDTIQFAKRLAGAITLTTGQIDISHDLTLQGTGAGRIRISGNDASRIFRVVDLDTSDTEVPDLNVSSLALVKGLASAEAATSGQAAGGAIAFLAVGGNLNLTNVTLADNRAVGANGGDAAGGAVFFLAAPMNAVTLTNCLVSGNQALGGGDGGLALGGAVAAVSASGSSTGHIALATDGTTFRDNRAIGGDGGVERASVFLAGPVGQVGSAVGGAVVAVGVRYFLSASSFIGNSAQGGSGGSSDLGVGGPAFSNSFVGSAAGGAAAGIGFGNINSQSVLHSTFTDNSAIGGSDAVGKAPGSLSLASFVGSGLGGAQFAYGCYATTTNSTFTGNLAAGGSNNSADASGATPPIVSNGRGGAIYLGGYGANLTVSDSLVANNHSRGGEGGYTSPFGAQATSFGPLNGASGGGIQSDSVDTGRLDVRNTIVRNNVARGGLGGDGRLAGSSFGGGIVRMAGGFVILTGVTVMENAAIGADGVAGVGSETGGEASGGGIYAPGILDLTTLSKVTGNQAIAGNGAGAGTGGVARGGGGLMSGRIIDSEFDGNSAIAGEGGISLGGGLMTVIGASFERSAITNNSALHGGGVYNLYGDLAFENSTIAQNTAVLGGGLFLSHLDLTFKSDVTLNHVTIARNVASAPAEFGDGGSAVYTDLSTNETAITNSIVSDNVGVVWGGEKFGIGYLIEGDFNYWDDVFIRDSGSNTIFKNFGTETDVLLGPLGLYGGPTRTIPLLPGSVAIDAAGGIAVVTDQRGIRRPQNTAADIGAFESQGFQISIVSGSNQSTAAGKRFAKPLVVKVSAVNPIEPVIGGVVTFTPPAAGASAVVGPSKRVSITRSKRVSVTATANRLKGKYTLRAGGHGFNVPAEFVLTNR